MTIRHQETGTIHLKHKTIKKEDTNRASGDRLRDLPEWIEEFTENLEDTEVSAPAHTDSKRPTKVAPRKQIIFTHFPKDLNFEVWQGLLAEDALAKQYLEQKILVKQITKSLMREVNLETITDTQSWYKIWPLNGFNLIRAKQKHFRRRKRVSEKFSSRQKSRKSFTLTTHWNLAKPVKIYHYVNATQIGNKWDCRKSSAQSKRGYICGAIAVGSGLWKVGGFNGALLLSAQRPRPLIGRQNTSWPVILFGAMVVYFPITARDQLRLHQFGKQVSPGIFFGCALLAGGIWKGDILVAEAEEWEKMDASEIHARRLNAKDVLPPMNGESYSPGRRWNSQTIWRRSGSENIHLNPGPLRPRRGTRSFSRRIRRTLLQTLFKMTQHAMMQKLKMTSGLLREISFIAITWNQGQTVHAERRMISFPTEVHRRYQNNTYVTECIVGKTCWWSLERGCRKNCQMHGQASQDSSYQTKGHLKDVHGPGGDLQGNKQPQDQTMYGRICGSKCLMQRKAKQNKAKMGNKAR